MKKGGAKLNIKILTLLVCWETMATLASFIMDLNLYLFFPEIVGFLLVCYLIMSKDEDQDLGSCLIFYIYF